MTIVAQAEEDQVKAREWCVIWRKSFADRGFVVSSRLFRFRLPTHPHDPLRCDPQGIDQDFLRHPVIAVRVVRRDTAFISEK